MFEQLLKAIYEELLIEGPPVKTESEPYSVAINDELKITFIEQESGICMWGKIGPCPTLKKEDLFIYLMKANFLGQGTGGSAIGLDQDENFLTLSLVLPYDMNYIMFRDALEDFANYIDYWKAELIRHTKAAEQQIL